MTTAIESLLRGLFDYSGLFPPARLGMAEAVANYRTYRDGERAWMLGRFCCPAGRLAEMRGAVAGDWGVDPLPWRVAAISAGGLDNDALLLNLDEELGQMRLFEIGCGGDAVVDSLETKLPILSAYSETRADMHSRQMEEFFDHLGAKLAEAPLSGPLEVFVEFPFAEGWRESLPRVAKAAARANALLADDPDTSRAVKRFALKIRCGGLNAKAFPEPKQVAAMILACRDAGAPFKATAGLHSPARHWSAELQATRHGFFNVFMGSALALAREFDAPELLEVLFDERADAFRFRGEEGAWKPKLGSAEEVPVLAEEIAAAREGLALSIGSCSFAEPNEHLEKLGLLPATGAWAPK